MAAKVAKKAEMKKAEAEAAAQAETTKPPVVRKKVPKKKDLDLDDLLSAGLKKK